MESQPHQQKQKKPHHPHHVLPKHETGYTDEAAEECHDLIDRAEEEAHVSRPLQNSLLCYLPKAIAIMKQKMLIAHLPFVVVQLHEPGSMYSTGAMYANESIPHVATSSKSTGMQSTAREAAAKMEKKGHQLKETVAEKMGQMKETMNIKK
jgi:hypothetical protein